MTGLDADPDMLKVAKYKSAQLKAPVKFDVGFTNKLPYPDESFDRVLSSIMIHHLKTPDKWQTAREVYRVLKPGGRLAVTVPRWLPERVCWLLSDEYHSNEGGHIRIYTDAELIDKVTKAGMVFDGRDYAHGLHTPYWWIKCAVGVNNDEHPLVKAYHQLLVWEIVKQPKILQWAGAVLDPVIGKSMVLYFHKPAA